MIATLALAVPAGPAAAEVSGLGSVAVGYEDNVVLAPDQVTTDADRGDNFFEVFGVGMVPLARSGGTELALKGSAYVLDYWDLSDFDLATLRAGPELSGGSGPWEWWLEASAARVYLDDDAFEQIAAVEAGMERDLAPGLRGQLAVAQEWVTAYRPYRYLGGGQQQVTAALAYTSGDWELEGGYELALNDRRDLSENGDFASYSPTRHTLFGELGARKGAWRLSLEGEVRFSRYNDPHRQNGVTRTREDTRYQGAVRLVRGLGAGWSAFGEVNRTVNDSNLDGAPFTNYNYRTNYYLVGIDRLF